MYQVEEIYPTMRIIFRDEISQKGEKDIGSCKIIIAAAQKGTKAITR